MTDRLQVDEEIGLFLFMTSRLSGWSRKKLKQRLSEGCVWVNGEAVTQHDHALKVGDDVEVRPIGAKPPAGRLQILYFADDLIAINKPEGLLSVASTREGEAHALEQVREQCAKPGHTQDLRAVHRIDKDTSGVLLFAATREARDIVTGAWSDAEKVYLAIVEGIPEPDQGTIRIPLRMDDRGFRAHVGSHPDAKPAITHYETIRSAEGRTLLQIRLDTGRQHQIRAHMAWLGHPVIGDARYGTKGKRLGLHALRLTIASPRTGEPITIEAPPPRDFLGLIRKG